MFRVGLTGGIGSGKSTVADLFANLGVSIIDTDIIAHQITQPDGPAYQAIINTFGDDILCIDNTIDRRKLASIIFHSKDKKKQLEALLHPLIWIIVEQQTSAIQSPYAIVVVPLLFEGKHQSRFHSTLVVNCTEEMQISRVKQRDHQRNTSDIKAIINNQINSEDRIKLADQIINNIDNLELLKLEVKRLHNYYLDKAAKAI